MATDKVLQAFLAAPIAAEAARVVGVDGKRFRDYLRKTHGAYASKGTGWATMDVAARTLAYERFTPKVNAPK